MSHKYVQSFNVKYIWNVEKFLFIMEVNENETFIYYVWEKANLSVEEREKHQKKMKWIYFLLSPKSHQFYLDLKIEQ